MYKMIILTPERIRMAEDRANKAGLSYLKMMENAGKGCSKHILKKYGKAQRIVVLCGKGKNGGDGFVIARCLTYAGKKVTVIKLFDTPSDALSESRRELVPPFTPVITYSNNKAIARRALEDADITVDAVFGIGFSGALPNDVREVNRICASSNSVKIAIDLPSGVSINGIAADCFRADETFSMLCLKKEHVYKPFSENCGKVTVIPIGISVESSRGLFTACPEELRGILPPRPFNSNKGTFGKAAIIAGSRKMPGAAILAAKGAVSSGAGLVSVVFPDACRDIICGAVPECIHEPLKTTADGMLSAENTEDILRSLSTCRAAAIGCGLGKSEDGAKILDKLLHSYKGILIIDADGINILAEHMDLLKNVSCTVLLTPHPGEMSRLTGMTVEAVNASREKTAALFAREYGVYVLLKGANTVIATPDGKIFINTTGSTALSRGGSGDLLTGITVSLAAQGLTPTYALVLGAYLHGAAGEIAEKHFSPYAATVERITDCLPESFLRLYECR